MAQPVLNVIDRGAGSPAVVLIHGFTCSSSDWDEQLPVLSAHRRCVAVDLPGHGASPASREATIQALGQAVNRTLDALALDDVVLVGHSMGCRVASETYSQRRDRVRGIVYVDGSILASGDPEPALARARQTIERSGMAGVVNQLYDGFFVDSTPPAMRDRLRAHIPAVDLEFSRRLWLDLIRWDAERSPAVLATLDVPVLVVQSTALDTQLRRVSLMPGQSAPWPDAVLAAVKGAQLVVIPGVGHFPMVEAPEETHQALRNFLSRLG
jgi:pimeloyl-ACP methyl ester carboxylesterase